MTILVSACLLGLRCRYDGQSKPNAAVLALGKSIPSSPAARSSWGDCPRPAVPQNGRGTGSRTGRART